MLLTVTILAALFIVTAQLALFRRTPVWVPVELLCLLTAVRIASMWN